MNWQKIGILLLLSIVSMTAFALAPRVLNSVSYQLTEQKWIKINHVLVTVFIDINATVSDQNVETLRRAIMKNLQNILVGDWHIIDFSRSKSDSGLEVINVQAQIRVSADVLGPIYQQVKSISKAGQAYRVASLDFRPDLADIQNVQTELRRRIYAKVRADLKQLNNQFQSQRYFVHQIRFMSAQPMPSPMALVQVQGSGVKNNAALGAEAMVVSQMVKLTAAVTLSSESGETSHE